MPTAAVIADIGNDLVYEEPVETILEWIETALDRLHQRGAACVLNNVPLASARTLGPMRYRLFRSIVFPACRLDLPTLLARAEALSAGISELAESRKTPVFSGESAWYGFDPIHPKRGRRFDIWRQMLGALGAGERGVEETRPSFCAGRTYRRLKPLEYSLWGLRRGAEQPCARLADGSSIALF